MKKCTCRLLSGNAFQRFDVQSLFSVTFGNWDWLWKKNHISLFLVSDCESTDSLFWLFLSTSGKTSQGVSFWYESFLPPLIHLINGSSSQIFSNVNKYNFFHSQTDRLPFFLITFRGHSFFSRREKKVLKTWVLLVSQL